MIEMMSKKDYDNLSVEEKIKTSEELLSKVDKIMNDPERGCPGNPIWLEIMNHIKKDLEKLISENGEK